MDNTISLLYGKTAHTVVYLRLYTSMLWCCKTAKLNCL